MNIVVRYVDGSTKTADFDVWTIVHVTPAPKAAVSTSWGGEFASRQSVVPQLEGLALNGDELYASVRVALNTTSGSAVKVGPGSVLVVTSPYVAAPVRLPLKDAVSVRLV